MGEQVATFGQKVTILFNEEYHGQNTQEEGNLSSIAFSVHHYQYTEHVNAISLHSLHSRYCSNKDVLLSKITFLKIKVLWF